MSEENLNQELPVAETPAEGEAPEVAPEAPKPPDTSWVPKRISEITAARRAAEQRAEQLEQELARLRANPAPQGDAPQHQWTGNQDSFDALVQARAQGMAQQEAERNAVNQKIASINEAGVKAFGDDFQKSVDNLNMAGIGGADFIRVLTSVPNAEKLVTYLGKVENLNDAMRIATMDPVQMGIEMTKMATQAAKALSPQISRAPNPPTLIDGNGSADAGTEPDPKDTAKWMEWRAKNRKSKR